MHQTIQKISMGRRAAMALIGAIATLALASCHVSREAPDAREVGLTRLNYFVSDANGLADIKTQLIGAFDDAESKIDFATQSLSDGDIADALVRAKERGVAVSVVTDDAARDDAGIQTLEQADITISYGDGELRFLPEPTLTSLLEQCTKTDFYTECTQGSRNGPVTETTGLMVRPNDYNLMSNNFAVIDDIKVWNFSSSFDGRASYWFGWRAHSYDLAFAFDKEFQQMEGGVFATTLDVYNGPIKSTVHGIVYDSRLPDSRPGRTRDLQPGYITDGGIVRIEFNPQQRLVKEIIDEIYRSRSSVTVMTDELRHEFAINALAYKARNGFDVRVILREGAELPQQLVDLGVVRTAPSRYDYLPTVVITDEGEDRNGDTWARTLLVLSHSFMSQAPFRVLTPQMSGDPFAEDDVVRIYPADLYADGTMYTLREFLTADPNSRLEEIDRHVDFLGAVWDGATPTQ